MRPDRHPPTDGTSWLDELGPADFLVTGGAEVGDDQVPLLVVDKVLVLVRNQKGVPPAPLSGRFERLPKPFAVQRVKATQLSVAADAVDIFAREDGGRDDRV